MAIPLKYNFRSLLVRRISTLMTIISIALIVMLFVGVMALANGLETVLTSTGDPLNVIVLSRGADSELLSSVPHEAFASIRYLSGVQPDSNGEPLAAAEIVTVSPLQKRNEDLNSNLTIRGVSPQSLTLRTQIRIIAGRTFQPGLHEALVSQAVVAKIANTSLGDTLQVGTGEWKIVGIFDAGNTAYSSEIWVDVNQLANDFKRPAYSSITLRAANQAALGELINRIDKDPSINLAAEPEESYYKELTQVARPLKTLGMMIAIIMGIGACLAAMNTMYSTVGYRTHEIATMRTLGFKRRNILLSFLAEALLLTLIGGLLGCLLTIPVNGLSTNTINMQTFSEVAFAFRVSPTLLLLGMLFALLIGLFGGIFPAWHATRVKPTMVLREE